MSVVELSASLRADYVQLLETQFGLELTSRQIELLDGEIEHVLVASSYAGPAELHAAFVSGLQPDLLRALATSVTVGETHFFRVKPQIEALRRIVLPDLIARHATDRRLRLWSAGCSTGEEPYTLAMLLCEQSAELVRDWDIQLVATDLNRAALEVARRGVYSAWSLRETPPDIRTRYFTPVADGWRLNDRVRAMVRFKSQNLVDAPLPFADTGEPIDLILCRNVTIYFAARATQHLYARFGHALSPLGWLVLGPSDPTPQFASELKVVVIDDALLWRRAAMARGPGEPVDRSARSVARPASMQPRARVRAVDPVTYSAPRAAASPSMDPLVHLQVGMQRLGEGASAAAIESLRRAAFLDETSALVQFSLGRAYRQNGDPARSRSAFFRARRLLAGHVDDECAATGDLAAGELRHAVDLQLADLDRTAS